jgi:WD40 repeat protein
VYEEEEDPSNKSFFSEIISSVSDVKFSRDGRYILSRDYLTLRIWDINMDSRPIKTINVHDHLRSKLCDLYENDCIFDKFECTFSGDGECVSSTFLSLCTLFSQKLMGPCSQVCIDRVVQQLLSHLRPRGDDGYGPAS